MENLCRLCGSEDGIKVGIFEQGSERVKRIHKVLPIMVDEHDPFPKQMCHHCSYKVEQFYEFRVISIQTQEMFRSKVAWLKDKQVSKKNKNQQEETPMVQVSLTGVSAMSPSERVSEPSNNTVNGNHEDLAILIEDSPPYEDSTNAACSDTDEPVDPGLQANKSKRSKKSRSLWDTKKKKRNRPSRKPCKILEVFSTNEQTYQSLNNNENNPLPLHPAVIDLEDNSVENNPSAVNSPRNELGVVEKGILTDDRAGDNIALPKSILTTKIPNVGNVYTCEDCGVTFLKPQPASLHKCPRKNAISGEEQRPKEDPPPHHPEDAEKNPDKDFYECDVCAVVFTRHSQLVSHQKKHTNQVDSSSDDSFRPFNKRKKHHTKRKHKSRLLDRSTNNYNSNMTDKTEQRGCSMKFT